MMDHPHQQRCFLEEVISRDDYDFRAPVPAEGGEQ